METKIDPRSSLKVVFTGESAVDDTGLKRELFSRRIHISQHYGKTGGILPIMAYAGRLHPKGVPFSGFRYMKGEGFH